MTATDASLDYTSAEHCHCGARMEAVGEYRHVAGERAAFAQRHAHCDALALIDLARSEPDPEPRPVTLTLDQAVSLRWAARAVLDCGGDCGHRGLLADAYASLGDALDDTLGGES